MNTSFINTIVRDIAVAIRDRYAERLADEIDAGHQNGKETLEILQESFDRLLAEIQPVTPTVVQTQSPSTPGKSTPSRVSADVLKDERGNPIKCQAIIKKTSLPCSNGAKHNVSGQHLCGVHVKSATNAQPDPNKKAGKASAPTKGTSSFSSIVGASSTSDNFRDIKIDDDISDIDD